MELERPRIRDATRAGVREPRARQGRRAHARAGGADHRRLPAGPVGARRRGAAGGGARRAGRRQVDGRPDLPGHARALPRVVRARLDEHDLVYCYLDAIYLKLRPDDEPAEGVLVAWGLTLEGQKVLLGLQLGSRESYECWLDFGRDLQARGMRAPALIIADGAPGDLEGHRGAVAGARSSSAAPSTRSGTSPASCPSGCTARSRRATGPSSTRRPPPATPRPGCSRSPATTGAPTRRRCATIDEHVDQLVAHLRFPLEHRKRTRSTNLLERTFVEVRRRTKIIGRFPGETCALSLIWAVLELASRGWRGITMTPKAVAEIERLRRGRTRTSRPALDRGGDRRLTFPHSGATSARVSPAPGTRPLRRGGVHAIGG